MFGKILNKTRLAIIVAAGAIFMSQSSVAALATTGTVYMAAEPGSYVGGGLGAPEVTWVHGDHGILSAVQNFDKGVDLTFETSDSWSFNFAAPTYNPDTNTNDGNFLEVGFYDNAERFPFNSPTRPGMDVGGAGRGNNTLSGWFNVLEVEYGEGTDINRFAVDFRQFGESTNQTGPSLFGSLRFNSSIPITPVPEPEAYTMLLLGLSTIYLAARRRKDLQSLGA